MNRDTPVGVAYPTPSDQLCSLVDAAGGRLDRGEAMRRLSVIRGIKSTRVAVGLALLDERLELDGDDLVTPDEEGTCSR